MTRRTLFTSWTTRPLSNPDKYHTPCGRSERLPGIWEILGDCMPVDSISQAGGGFLPAVKLEPNVELASRTTPAIPAESHSNESTTRAQWRDIADTKCTQQRPWQPRDCTRFFELGFELHGTTLIDFQEELNHELVEQYALSEPDNLSVEQLLQLWTLQPVDNQPYRVNEYKAKSKEIIENADHARKERQRRGRHTEGFEKIDMLICEFVMKLVDRVMPKIVDLDEAHVNEIDGDHTCARKRKLNKGKTPGKDHVLLRALFTMVLANYIIHRLYRALECMWQSQAVLEARVQELEQENGRLQELCERQATLSCQVERDQPWKIPPILRRRSAEPMEH